jgi:hypothetical protein
MVGSTLGSRMMKTFLQRYLNEIVGLTIMALMTVALVYGQADAGSQSAMIDNAPGVVEVRLTISD